MQNLLNLLKKYTLQDALNIEKQDSQYKSLEKLFKNIQNKEIFLSLILANSIVCYQLSSTGEKYWEEFSNYFSSVIPAKAGINKDVNSNLIDSESYHSGYRHPELQNITVNEITNFLPNSKWNKRFVETKINRLKKLKLFLEKFESTIDFYMKNLVILRDELAQTMNQKKDAKTIVFAIKMLLYWYTIVNDWKSILCPFEIEIPIDSRLTQIFEKYKEDYTDIKLFYSDLSKKLQIPEIHLDAIIWVNFNELMK